MKVLILSGGTSPERGVSLKSGKNVSDALKSLDRKVINYDPKSGIGELLRLAKQVDFVFPILHGEGGTIQQILEENNIRFLGSKAESLRTTFSKDLLKKVCLENDIIIPRGEIV